MTNQFLVRFKTTTLENHNPIESSKKDNVLKARILVVDDEPDLESLIRQKFRKKIRSGELEVEFASNGQEALDKIKAEGAHFDLVMTDINMPVMDGLTLLVNMKETNRNLKAIVVSAYGDMQNIRIAMNRGAYDFVTKPIDFSDLEQTIEKTLEEVEILRQGQQAKEQLAETILEKERAEMEKDKARQSEKFKEQFLANMSHEIRTPMNAVVGLTNLVLKSELDETQSKYLKAIRQSADNLLVIINEILDLSKIEAGKIELENIDFSMDEVLSGVMSIMKFKSEEKGLDLLTEIDPAIPKTLVGDPTRLNQILINLAGNAIKFTESGKVTVKCHLVGKSNGKAEVKYEVIDTGIGIAQDKVQSVFESFSQASSDTTRKFGGTGLGLTISKKLVELQGGQIGVSSKLGEGTIFHFNGFYEIGVEDVDVQDNGHSIDDLRQQIKDTIILLVEDNPFNQMVAVDTLESLIEGVKIEVAENGQEAVDKIQTEPFQIVLMDVQMPVMDGYTATREIRKLSEPSGKTPIMAMTASATKAEIEKCFQSGMDEYISKPFDQDDLITKIANLVKKNN